MCRCRTYCFIQGYTISYFSHSWTAAVAPPSLLSTNVAGPKNTKTHFWMKKIKMDDFKDGSAAHSLSNTVPFKGYVFICTLAGCEQWAKYIPPSWFLSGRKLCRLTVCFERCCCHRGPRPSTASWCRERGDQRRCMLASGCCRWDTDWMDLPLPSRGSAGPLIKKKKERERRQNVFGWLHRLCKIS